MLINQQLQHAAKTLGDLLLVRKAKVCLAESCTGGAIAAAITSVAGSSQWFELGLVTYSNGFKAKLLQVPDMLIAQYGVVSEPVVKQMLVGACQIAGCTYGVTISGVAGPDGGTINKPVGRVCFAWGTAERPMTITQNFIGDRDSVREQSVSYALMGFIHYLKNTV